MNTRSARLASAMLALLVACFAVGFTGAAHAATPDAWTLLQSFVKSGDVHSPTFITPTRGWAVVGNRLLQTNDGGQRWTISVPPEWTTALPTALSFATPTHGWAVGDGFVQATADSGSHWNVQAADLAKGGDWLGVRGIDESRAFAVGTSGVVLGTDDGGTTWTQRFSATGSELHAITFADASHGWVVGTDASGKGLVLASTDGGASWAVQSNPAPAELSAVCFIDTIHGWAAGRGGVMRTSDSGVTWSAVGSPAGAPAGSWHASLAFVSATHGFLGVTDGAQGLWETVDGGVSWTPTSLATEPANVFGLVALDSAHVLATGLSLPAGEQLTTARIWNWASAAAGIPPTPFVGRSSTELTSHATPKPKSRVNHKAKAKKRSRSVRRARPRRH